MLSCWTARVLICSCLLVGSFLIVQPLLLVCPSLIGVTPRISRRALLSLGSLRSRRRGASGHKKCQRARTHK